MKKSAFTLAEIMIVLSVIAVLVVILLPSVKNVVPDKNLMNFKDSHVVFTSAISELVNSDKYYLNGDLGIRINGDLINSTHEGDNTYLCETLADVIDYKSKDCKDKNSGGWYGFQYTRQPSESARISFDNTCKRYQSNGVTKEVVFKNGTIFYQTSIHMPFGMSYRDLYQKGDGDGDKCLDFGNCNSRAFDYGGAFESRCKLMCLEIDGPWKGEDPFGYCVTATGKIFNGMRAQQWLEKSIQQKD